MARATADPMTSSGGRGLVRRWARAVRVRQWSKNLLVVAVPLAAGVLFDLRVAATVAATFVVFSLAASAVYLVNDVRDLEEDRQHPAKRHRPLAAGELTVRAALSAALVLAVLAVTLAVFLAPALAAVIGGYLASSLAYTLWLREQPVLDLAVVSFGFVLRALAGGVAIGAPVSPWFLLTAAFGALFMVAGKRYAELQAHGVGTPASRGSLAGYTPGYLRFVWTIAATLTVGTYLLWSFEMYAVLTRPALAQASVVPLLLGVLRYAVDVEQGRAGEPEEIVRTDRGLQLLGVLWLGLFAAGVWDV